MWEFELGSFMIGCLLMTMVWAIMYGMEGERRKKSKGCTTDLIFDIHVNGTEKLDELLAKAKEITPEG